MTADTARPEKKPLLEGDQPTSPFYKWGRHGVATALDAGYAASVMLFCPLLVIVCFVALQAYDGSMLDLVKAVLFHRGTMVSTISRSINLQPAHLLRGAGIYLGWLVFQVVLYRFLPGKMAQGQITPAGNLLAYKVNGLLAWIVSNSLFVAGGYFGYWRLSVVANHWSGLLLAANIYGYLLTLFAYFKARRAPTHPEDCKRSGSVLYDLYMGVELNPRFGEWFDFKLFHNGRPGIVAWTIINISYTARQHEKFGRITSGTIVTNLISATYVLDFFYNEDWYLRTIDIAHDHFGFYLAWGDAVWLPSMYTLQTQFLSVHPDTLSTPVAVALFLMGMAGYVIFRCANHEKDMVRRTKGEKPIWGRLPEVIRTTYTSSDGEIHHSLLLVSGFWGICRHANYLGDLVLSLAGCLACGSTYLVPYTYIIFMTILLVHRTIRDNSRCSAKYGQYWDEYIQRVRWTLVPYLW